MTHDDYAQQIPSWHENRLGPEESAAVAAHVATCDECRELDATWATLAFGVRDKSDAGAHPAVEALVQYALHPRAPIDGTLARHLDECADCRREHRAIREAEAHVRSAADPVAPRLSPGLTWGLLAATVMLVVLGYPAYRGLVALPQVESRVALLEQRAAADSGLVPLHHLRAVSRGDALPTLRVGADQTSVLLALTPRLPSDGADRYEILVSGTDGNVLLRWDVDAEQLTEQLRVVGALTVRLPLDRVTVSRIRLQVRPIGGDDVFDADFEIDRISASP